MEIKYQYCFEKQGTKIPDNQILENVVWLDVGNALQMGCFDHHHQEKEGINSTVSAVISNLDYLQNLKKSAINGQSIDVHMHKSPDMDCIVSFYIVKRYLELSDEEFEKEWGENGYARCFVEYVDDIDRGKNKIADHPTLYALICTIGEIRVETDNISQYITDKAIYVLDIVVEKLKNGEKINLYNTDLSSYIEISTDFAEEIELIAKAYADYEREKRTHIVSFENVGLWTKDGNLEEVPAAIWNHVASPLGYWHARNEGCVLTVVPYNIKGEGESDTTRVFTSINVDIPGTEKYTLKPIVDVIEQMEQVEEQILFEETGKYRRDRSKPRINSGEYLGEYPYSATSDPWYVNPEGDLFDAPRLHSLIEYSDIQNLLMSNGCPVKKSAVMSITEENVSVIRFNQTIESIDQWQRTTRDLLKDSKNHYMIFAELDSSLVGHTNKILETFCSYLVGCPYQDTRVGNILYLDYNTCIYSSLNYTIVLATTYDYTAENNTEKSNYESLPISKILTCNNENEIKESPIVTNLVKICKQRNNLLETGRELGVAFAKKNNRKPLESINSKLLTISAQMQADDMIDNQVEREVYSFMKDVFQIDYLKESIMGEMDLLVDESREKFVSKFNNASAIAVPFVLAATVFQMGIFRFDSIWNMKGPWAYVGWGIVVLIIFVATYILLRGRKK